MARTVEDLIIEVADKHSEGDAAYSFLKKVLNDFVSELVADERCYGDLVANYLPLEEENKNR